MLRQEMETQGNFLFRYRGLFPVPIVVFGVGAFAWTHWHGAFPWFQPGGWGAFICYAVSLLKPLLLFSRILCTSDTACNAHICSFCAPAECLS